MTAQRIIYPPLQELPQLRQALTAGEERVLDLFNRHLPPDWEIYVQPHLNGLRPDFVVLNPRGGIGVFEVKDWNLDAMRYFTKPNDHGPELCAETRDGKTFSLQADNPAIKVNLYKREIFDLYCPRLRQGNGWAAITAGVIFPFATSERVNRLLAPFLSAQPGDRYAIYQPVSGTREIASGNIEKIFPEATRKSSSVMSEDHAMDLRGWLVEPDFSVTQRKPLILDRNQRNLANTRTKSGYRRLKGPAGSGKSLVIAARAAKLAKEGKSVLVATYNITLWHYLRDLIVRELDAPQQLRNIQFTNFHHWCKLTCHEMGWKTRYDELWKAESEEDALNETLPKLAGEAVDQPGARKYDAILVDEGQDYRPLWWDILRKACRPDGEMLLVADATQDIYGTAGSWTDEVMTGAGFPGGQWSQLSVSYRLPPSALDHARKFASTFLPEKLVDLPEQDQESLDLFPCQLRWVQCDPASAHDTCADEVISMMAKTGKDGVANADITLLADRKASGAKVVECLSRKRIRTVNTFSFTDDRRQKMAFFMGRAELKATTLHSFKGWEARLLVVYITSAAHIENLALLYAGLTRLKRSAEGSSLTVVCSTPELEKYGKSFPEHVARPYKQARLMPSNGQAI